MEKFFEKDGVVYFHLERASAAGSPAIPFVFEGPATDKHKSEYKAAWKAFTKEKEVEKDVVTANKEASEGVDLPAPKKAKR